MSPPSQNQKKRKDREKVQLQGPQNCKMPWQTMVEQRKKKREKEKSRERQARRREALKKTGKKK